MNWIILMLLIFSPAVLAVVVSVYLNVHLKKEQQDEKEYLKTLTEEGKKDYELQKKMMFAAQQHYFRVNAMNSNNRIV